MVFRILKGTHVSHFHEECPHWPRENFYEQDKPLWWGKLCDGCARLTDLEASQALRDLSRKAGTGC